MNLETALQIKPKLGTAFFLIIGTAVLYRLVTQENIEFWHQAYLLLILVAAWELKKNVTKILSPKKFSLRIDPEGLCYFRASKELLRWNEVGEVSSYKLWGKTLIRIRRKLENGSYAQSQADEPIVKAHRLLHRNDVLVDTSVLKTSPEELLQTIKAYAQKYGAPAARNWD